MAKKGRAVSGGYAISCIYSMDFEGSEPSVLWDSIHIDG